MEEVIAFVKKAEKYLRSSEVLIFEDDYDSSVSRTYYAIFHLASALLKTKNISVSTHKGVHAQFAEQFVKTGIFPKESSQLFRESFDDRQVGDYDALEMIEKRSAQKLLERGKEFLKEVKWGWSHFRPQIVGANLQDRPAFVAFFLLSQRAFWIKVRD
ncbi:MAG: HEPN domain-containing protein [SAR324 cluster bacterium]|nr:HEPN domain-containing protein [SAR324 cluster bacterium]